MSVLLNFVMIFFEKIFEFFEHKIRRFTKDKLQVNWAVVFWETHFLFSLLFEIILKGLLNNCVAIFFLQDMIVTKNFILSFVFKSFVNFVFIISFKHEFFYNLLINFFIKLVVFCQTTKLFVLRHQLAQIFLEPLCVFHLLEIYSFFRININYQGKKFLSVFFDPIRSLEFSFNNFLIQNVSVFFVEGQIASQHCKQNNSQRPNVSFSGLVFLSRQHFRRGIARRPTSSFYFALIVVKSS